MCIYLSAAVHGYNPNLNLSQKLIGISSVPVVDFVKFKGISARSQMLLRQIPEQLMEPLAVLLIGPAIEIRDIFSCGQKEVMIKNILSQMELQLGKEV